MLVRGTTPVERTAFDYGRRHQLDIQRLELVALERSSIPNSLNAPSGLYPKRWQK